MFFLSSVLICWVSRLQLFSLPSLRPPRTFRTLNPFRCLLLSCAGFVQCPHQAPEQRSFWYQMFPDVTHASVTFTCSIHRQSIVSLMQSSFRTKVSFLLCFQEWDWAATGMFAAAAAAAKKRPPSRGYHADSLCQPGNTNPSLLFSSANINNVLVIFCGIWKNSSSAAVLEKSKLPFSPVAGRGFSRRRPRRAASAADTGGSCSHANEDAVPKSTHAPGCRDSQPAGCRLAALTRAAESSGAANTRRCPEPHPRASASVVEGLGSI